MADVIKRIHSKGQFNQEEYVAGAAGIYPGMLLKMNSSNEVIVNPTSTGVLGDEVIVALEDQLQGGDVDTVYTDDTIVTCILPLKGSVVNMLLKDGESVAIGDKLMCGAGGLLAAASSPKVVVGVAMAALDLSATANTTNQLMPVRIV